jgi:prepilin-type N-terminal cleavage/methylation domain-containing protein
MILNNKNRETEGKRGFTIVELLIVIVIIAVLAAIAVVAYNGIQARAKTSSTQTNTTKSLKKASSYHAETGSYPAAPSTLTSAGAASTTYYLTGITFDATALSSSNLPTSPSELNFYKCGTGASSSAPTILGDITTQTGVRIDYWNYMTTAIVISGVGIISGSVGANAVGCVITT